MISRLLPALSTTQNSDTRDTLCSIETILWKKHKLATNISLEASEDGIIPKRVNQKWYDETEANTYSHNEFLHDNKFKKMKPNLTSFL